MPSHNEIQPGADADGNLAPPVNAGINLHRHVDEASDAPVPHEPRNFSHHLSGVTEGGEHHARHDVEDSYYTPHSTPPTNIQSSIPPEKMIYETHDEKTPYVTTLGEQTEFLTEEERQEAGFTSDPFKPFDDLPEENHNVLTIRAIIVGLICGTLVNASNLYLGLKSGWSFGANLLGAVVGFGVLQPLSRTFSERVPILGGRFGPRENNIVQTVATASGGLSNVFISAYPALYQLKLLDTPANDYWRIVSLTAVGGYFGFFFATPLRKFFIIYVARELRMVFPSSSATALTIRSMHDLVGGAAIGKQKMKALAIAFVVALVLRVSSQYAVGLLWEWHFFTWFYVWGNYNNSAIAVENWGWFVQFTPAFIGSGMLVGLNVALSFLGGSVLAWGIIGPLLVHFGAAFGKPKAPNDPNWSQLMNFASFSPAFLTKDHPSPRYWLLWPGVLAMIAISFTELALQWKVISFAFRAVYRGSARGIHDISVRRGKEIVALRRFAVKEEDQKNLIEDPALPEDLVKTWMWLPGLLLVIILMCVVLGAQYGMPVGMSLLSVFLAFFFSFLAIQCTGVTDITPLTAASKASQIILGGATKGEGWDVTRAQRLNLLGGALANLGANQATDLVSDFRVGFLLRTPPIQQWLGQGLGTVAAVFIAPLLFQLFMKAYPCVIDTTIEKCAFAAPSVAAWKAVAVAVTDPTFPIPTSSGIFSIIFSIFGSIMVLIRHFVWTGKLEWVRAYHPNMMCIALAFVLPQTYYGTAMCMGAFIAIVWTKRNPGGFEILGYAVAAGLIAGEGIGGVINAILQLANISGEVYNTPAGCPLEC